MRGIEHSGEASRWRVCYQRGLPCLVSIHLLIKTQSNPINLFLENVGTITHHLVRKAITEKNNLKMGIAGNGVG